MRGRGRPAVFVICFLAIWSLASALTGGKVSLDAAMARISQSCVVVKGSAYVPATCAAPVGDVGAAVAEPDPAPGPTPVGGKSGDMGAKGGTRTLSPAQIRDVWLRHGGDPAQADVAQAVARAESGGRPDATNSSNTDKSIDRGLFQINTVHGDCSTYDLERNVQCAVDLQRGQGWRPWVAYNTGAYKKYLGAS